MHENAKHVTKGSIKGSNKMKKHSIKTIKINKKFEIKTNFTK